ncbi:hypothetical protein [Planctomicrobium piriforme]|uniref:Uncharacterized protein n=1 Tax=Planctomicrobium piriforme TaxID=1576369 RepID=A0A1I3KAG4_9PLAN|nr:hypothetical protein [Planctomicrobium piriforme]SFI69482.1 hypothetical protein SAMN05421753_111168 [Planctomicrobium piriforme]
MPHNHPSIGTLSLFSLLLTVWAWQLEAGVLLLHFLVNKKLDSLGHGALLTLSIALTLFAVVKGKSELKKFGHTGGRIELTTSQIALVTMLTLMMGASLGLIVFRLVNN